MAISPALVKELRGITGAGMMDCKRALEEAGGDKDEAIKILRKKGMATAAKKSARAASDGLIASHITDSGKVGVLIEVNCETDFVAKTDNFQKLMSDLTLHVAEAAPRYLNKEEVTAEADKNDDFYRKFCLLDQPMTGSPDTTVNDVVVAIVAKLGENIKVRRFARFAIEGDGVVGSYIHAGGKVGVLMEVTGPSADSEDFQELLKDLTMQVAAASPRFVDQDSVSEDVINSEKEIYKSQAIAQGKPEAIAEKIVTGKLNKFFQEACLVDQEFIKDTDIRVKDRIKDTAGKVGGEIKVNRFERFQLGEGLS